MTEIAALALLAFIILYAAYVFGKRAGYRAGHAQGYLSGWRDGRDLGTERAVSPLVHNHPWTRRSTDQQP